VALTALARVLALILARVECQPARVQAQASVRPQQQVPLAKPVIEPAQAVELVLVVRRAPQPLA
jgi:hypothetical protein